MLRRMSSPTERTESAALGELFTLAGTHTDTRAVIAPQRGALVTSFQVAGRELLYMDDSTLYDASKNVRGGIPVLFPSPGKLTSDTFAHEGRVGTDLKQHGFARLMAWHVAHSSADTLALELESDASTLARFPWSFQAQLSFHLIGRCLQLRFTLRNTDTTALPFALGYHPYFRVAEADKAHVSIASHATQAFDNVRKQIVPFQGFDLTQHELDIHLLDHGSDACALAWPDGSQLRVRADPEFAVWVVWTLAQRDFVCIEPWTARGGALNSGLNLLTVEPGHARTLQVELEFLPARA
jgi:galactose mutarotase-like enzyme